ncbi:hypothetical protein OROGR_006869 [Orobanche gracilis]
MYSLACDVLGGLLLLRLDLAAAALSVSSFGGESWSLLLPVPEMPAAGLFGGLGSIFWLGFGNMG